MFHLISCTLSYVSYLRRTVVTALPGGFDMKGDSESHPADCQRTALVPPVPQAAEGPLAHEWLSCNGKHMENHSQTLQCIKVPLKSFVRDVPVVSFIKVKYGSVLSVSSLKLFFFP